MKSENHKICFRKALYLGSDSKPQFMLYLQNLKIYKYEEMQNLYIPNPFSPAPIIAIVAINVANAPIIEQVECIEESFDYLIWDNDLKTIVKSGKVKSKACISLKYKAIEGDQRITNIHIALVKEIFKKTPFTKLLEAGDFK